MSLDAETEPRPRRWLAFLPLAAFVCLAALLFLQAQRRRSGAHSLGPDRPVRPAADAARP